MIFAVTLAYLLPYLYPNSNETDRNNKEALVILLMDIIETKKVTLKLIQEYLDYIKLPKKGLLFFMIIRLRTNGKVLPPKNL